MLEGFSRQGMGGVFVHPRPGLRTEYLSERWFELWNFAAQECQKRGLQCNIYDENSYPSGFGGGHVVSGNPCLGKVRTEFRTLTSPPSKEDGLLLTPLAVCSANPTNKFSVKDLTKASPANPLEVLFLVQDVGFPFLAGLPYADLSKAETTDAFIQCTHEAYRAHCGEWFGETTRFVFTDEPTLQSLSDYGKIGLVYSYAIEAEFRREHGYGLLDSIDRLVFNRPDSAAVRYDYGKTINRLFTQNFVGRVEKWCSDQNLSFTGHFNEHHWPLPGDPPSVMSALRHMKAPGNDLLAFQFFHEDRATSEYYRLNLHELRSVANQYDKKRTLVESCGGGGYGFTLKQTKALEDFVMVHGVNLINPHLCYSTLSGSRKYDWPQTFTDHTPWMEVYREESDHVARVAWALSQGAEMNRTLVIHPTSSSWVIANYSSSFKEVEAKLDAIRVDQVRLLNDLTHAQIDFDLGEEILIEEDGFVNDGKFGVGQRAYDLVVIPATVLCLAARTVDRLREFLAAGGTVLALCEPPTLVDGRPSQAVVELAHLSQEWKYFETIAPLIETLKQILPPRISTPQGDPIPPEICFRRVEVSQSESLFYFCNPWNKPVATEIQLSGQAVESLDTASGIATTLSPMLDEGRITFPLVLPPAGHAFYRILQTTLPVAKPVQTPVLKPTNWTFSQASRLAPNVLTLDYCDLKTHQVDLKSVPTVLADQACWQAMGFKSNLWYASIQFRRNFVEAAIPNPGSLSVTYRFHIVSEDLEKVRTGFRFAVERPQLYTISCNGTQIETASAESWFDEEIRSYLIEAFIQAGENSVTLHATEFTTLHEIAPAYLLGNFATRPCEQGFEIIGELPISLGDWSSHGLHFYKESVRYSGTIDLPESTDQLWIQLDQWKGSMSHILIDGQPVGTIWRAPFELSFSQPLKAGRHEVTIDVVGNLKNQLGPHFCGTLRLPLECKPAEISPDTFPLLATWEQSPSPQPGGETYQFEANGLLTQPRIYHS